MEEHFLVDEKDNVSTVFAIGGYGFSGQGQNVGLAFIRLKDWGERHGADSNAQAIAERANKALASMRAGQALAFAPPAVVELGNATGFDLQLVDVGRIGHERLIAARDKLLELAGRDKMLTQVRPNGLEDVPQLKVKVDQPRAGALGLDQGEVNDTLSTALGGSYVNDFVDRGRVKKVFVQSDAAFRSSLQDVDRLYVRGASGAMVPFSAFADSSWSFGPARLERYNGRSSVQILGAPAPGYSSGTAMARMEELGKQLPEGTALQWNGISYEERLSGGQAPALYALSILIVFLSLAALYESWSVPIAVILVVPLGVIGALLAALLTGLNNDIYLQVGLITTVGVAAKNAILIVEFAEEKMRAGMGAGEAALEAAKLRLRPILMTSFAFIFGVLPLAISAGAGAGGQNAIGRSVVGGMLTATVLAIFFVPMFFLVVKKLFRQDAPRAPEPSGGKDAPPSSLEPQEA